MVFGFIFLASYRIMNSRFWGSYPIVDSHFCVVIVLWIHVFFGWSSYCGFMFLGSHRIVDSRFGVDILL
jgi:hypothetical protein